MERTNLGDCKVTLLGRLEHCWVARDGSEWGFSLAWMPAQPALKMGPQVLAAVLVREGDE